MPTTRRSNITDNNSEMERSEDVHIVEPDERVSNNEKMQLNIKKYIYKLRNIYYCKIMKNHVIGLLN